MLATSRNLFLGLVCVWIGQACSSPKSSFSSTKTRFEFSDWQGVYEGTFQNYSLSNPNNAFGKAHIRLEIAPTDSSHRWWWKSTFTPLDSNLRPLPAQSIQKNYQLVKPDSLKPNLFWLDEGAGVRLEQTFFDNTFFCAYDAFGMRFQTITEKKGKYIQQEIVIQASKPNNWNVLEKTDTCFIYRTLQVQKIRIRKTK